MGFFFLWNEFEFNYSYFQVHAEIHPMYDNKRIKFGSSRTFVNKSDEFSALGILRINIFPFVDNDRT